LMQEKHNNFFLDKSELINEFLSVEDTSILLTRPRRMGKSLILSMLNYFFSPIDCLGKDQSERESLYHCLFFGGKPKDPKYQKIKFHPMKIKTFGVEDERGKNPVVNLDFKIVNGTKYEDLLQGFADVIQSPFKEHQYLIPKLIYEQENYIHYMNSKTLTENEIAQSLRFLVTTLYSYYQADVVLLIDEIDHPLQNILTSKAQEKNPEQREKIDKEMMKCSKLLSTLLGPVMKGNKKIKFAFAVGIFNPFNNPNMSDLNNLLWNDVQGHEFQTKWLNKYLGFTKEEIEGIFEELPDQTDKAAEIKEVVLSKYISYYLNNKPIYSPFQIIQVFAKIVDTTMKYDEKLAAIKGFQNLRRNGDKKEEITEKNYSEEKKDNEIQEQKSIPQKEELKKGEVEPKNQKNIHKILGGNDEY